MEGGDAGPAVISLTPSVIEPLGPHTLLLGEIDGARVTPQVDAHFPAAPGEACRITLNMTQMHLFDSDTEQAI